MDKFLLSTSLSTLGRFWSFLADILSVFFFYTYTYRRGGGGSQRRAALCCAVCSPRPVCKLLLWYFFFVELRESGDQGEVGKHISRRKEEKSEWEKFNKNENTNAWPKPALEKSRQKKRLWLALHDRVKWMGERAVIIEKSWEEPIELSGGKKKE